MQAGRTFERGLDKWIGIAVSSAEGQLEERDAGFTVILAVKPLIYAAVFANAAAAAFDNPARQALLPSLVPIEAFPRAVTISSTAINLPSPSAWWTWGVSKCGEFARRSSSSKSRFSTVWAS